MFANVGTSVLNRVVAADPSNRFARRSVPWIAVPFEVISATFPLATWLKKNGLYGTRTRDGCWVARVPSQ